MGDCDACKTACGNLNCSEDCTGDGCFTMAEENCEAAPKACFYCPCKYACYGAYHCVGCISDVCRGNKPQTASDIRFDMQMYEDDEICHDNHVCGCLCCPCFLSAAALGFVGWILTCFGSAMCCMTGCCCKGCDECKSCSQKNSVSPSS